MSPGARASGSRAGSRGPQSGLIYGSALRSGARVTTDSMSAIALHDEAGGDWRPVIVQDRHEPGRIDLQFGRQQGAHLLVAVLFDDEDPLVIADKVEHVVMEREGADAQRVEWMPRASSASSASSIASDDEPK